MYYAELGKPYMLLIIMRYPTVRKRDGIEGRRKWIKSKCYFCNKRR
jgi:hypothetical protein